MNPQMKEIIKTREKIVKISAKINQLEEQKEKLKKEIQSKCTHESVVEASHETETETAYYQPPIKICIICAFEEAGNDPKTLKAEPIKTMRRGTDFWNYRKLLPLTMIPICR